jgi:hypothetical protein
MVMARSFPSAPPMLGAGQRELKNHKFKNRFQAIFVGAARIFHEFEMFIGKASGVQLYLLLPQAPDNAANGLLGLARRVKIFLCSYKIGSIYKVSPENRIKKCSYIIGYLHKIFCVEKIS